MNHIETILSQNYTTTELYSKVSQQQENQIGGARISMNPPSTQ